MLRVQIEVNTRVVDQNVHVGPVISFHFIDQCPDAVMVRDVELGINDLHVLSQC